ncbi:hypothetical protein L873DRAFT_1785996 [Choiromyces venosus 120613-1]|uniref:Uncharacterized protein n=1 Tax=Choiromyces venosus 120613-1 TaxID=1336337 RepID=A0A3N4K2J9_9PEZI|nr:hypothetical protein L873DRAFT_1785996 [Choiromyces venosus 120613-1]
MYTLNPLLLLGILALSATTTTALPTSRSSPPLAGPTPPPPSPQPPQPPQDPTKTYEPNPLTSLALDKLSRPRKWMSEKPPPPPPSSTIPGVTPNGGNGAGPLRTDPIELQRFLQDLRGSRRQGEIMRRGIKSKSESLPAPQPEGGGGGGGGGEEVVVEPEELTEMEFDAMFEEYRLKHDITVGLPPKGERQEKWEGTKYGGFVEALMGAPGRGRVREVPQ